MNGIFLIDPENGRTSRPKSKKAVKEHLAANGPTHVAIEVTSAFASNSGSVVPLNEADSSLYGPTNPFVGPDPYNARNFYGQLIRKADGTFTVK